MKWEFYGRQQELKELVALLSRNRWFFVRISGRRRIGKTTLIQEALKQTGRDRIIYAQIPDSDPTGVLSAITDAMDIFHLSPEDHPRPTSLLELAKTIAHLAQSGYIIALDEFQYFNRKRLFEFTSFLQAEVDRLSSMAHKVPGGLFVLGSIHTEMTALLEDRSAPLFNRVTNDFRLEHLDVESVLQILRSHGNPSADNLLFLWNLFEGVPKFYRDCFEAEVLGSSRQQLLEKMFFMSSSPLRTEADNWFLKELRGRYDVILKFIARNPGCSRGQIRSHVRDMSPKTEEQIGSYLAILSDRYRMVEVKQPIFAKPNARKGRYYISDNFLRSWLSSLAQPVAAVQFTPPLTLIAEADRRLNIAEGYGLERLVAKLYEERSRKAVGDFPLSARIEGFWDAKGNEIDVIALSESTNRIRFVSCKRSPGKLLGDQIGFNTHVEKFLAKNLRFRHWKIEKAMIAPSISKEIATKLTAAGYIVEDLQSLAAGLG